MAGYFQVAGILSTVFLNLSKRGYLEGKLTSQLLVSVSAGPTVCRWTGGTDASRGSHRFLFPLPVDCCFIKLHFWLQGLLLTPHCFLFYPSCYSQSYSGKHLEDISMVVTIEKQVKSPFQMRSETRIWRKKECAEGKRRVGRKERKHLNSNVLYLPFYRTSPFWSVMHSLFFSPPPTPHHSPSPDSRAPREGVESQLLQPNPQQLPSRAGTRHLKQ